MKFITVFTIVCAMFTNSQAQTANDTLQILKAANNYIDGFYFGDTSKIYFSIDSMASKHGYSKRRTDSVYRKIPMSFNQMVG